MLTPARLAELARLTLADPEKGGRAVLALDLSVPARWMALLCAVVVGVVLAYAPLALTGDLAEVPAPLATAGLQLGANLFAIVAMTWIGRLLGGQGRAEDALLLVAWLQALMVLVQLAQLAVTLIAPPLTGLLMILAVALFFWLLTGFTQALHGFPARFPVLLGVIATMFAVAMLVTFVLLLVGFDPRAMTDV